MVRAIPINPWHLTDFLERVRPGIAVSAALHVGLFIALAYFLAFHPVAQVKDDDPNPPLIMRDFPPPQPPKTQETPKFKFIETPTLDDVVTTVKPLKVPPQADLDRRPPTVETTTEPPAPPVIINPKPIYRGGLVYPDRASEAGMSGYVDFSFIIEPDGSVGNPQVIDEVPDGYGFATAAKKAFPKWRFDPKLVDGKPVAAPAQIRVSFKLQ
jgi:periplasmic protein TonB